MTQERDPRLKDYANYVTKPKPPRNGTTCKHCKTTSFGRICPFCHKNKKG